MDLHYRWEWYRIRSVFPFPWKYEKEFHLEAVFSRQLVHGDKSGSSLSPTERKIIGLLSWIINSKHPGAMEKLHLALNSIFYDLTEELGETISINKSANELGVSRKTIKFLMDYRVLRGFCRGKRTVIFMMDVEILKKIQREMPKEFEKYIVELMSRYGGGYVKKLSKQKKSSCVNNKKLEDLTNPKVVNLQEWRQS